MPEREHPGSTGLGPSLPVFERIAPPPPPDLLRDRIEALTRPGDIVLDVASRGGWTARTASELGRRTVLFEADPLTRLLAEIVLRPPDLRHLDAAFQAIAAAPRPGATLRVSIDERFASRCPRCGRTNPADELIHEGETLVRKHYRCVACRDHVKGGSVQHAPADAFDLERAASAVAPDELATARGRLRERFAVPFPSGAAAGAALPESAPTLPDELLDLHTPRQLVGLAAILERIESDMRSPGVEAALRLALLHAVIPASRLNAYPARGASLRIAGGHVRPPTRGGWRERNPWLAFDDGYRLVRSFIQVVEASGSGPSQPRFGTDVRSLAEGGNGVVIRLASGPALASIAEEIADLERLPDPPRVRLVVGQVPPRANTERLSLGYLGTCWALGRDAAALLPLEPLFGPSPRVGWDAHAARITGTLAAAAPLVATDGRVVLFVDHGGAEGVVAAALGAVAAGYGIAAASLPAGDRAGADEPAMIQLVPPGAPGPGGPRTRANVPLPAIPGGSGDRELVASDRVFAAVERAAMRPFSPDEVGRTVTETAVAVLRERGEPADLDVLLGEVLVGLDRAGQLRRLVATAGGPDGHAAEPGSGHPADAASGPRADPPRGPRADPPASRALRPPGSGVPIRGAAPDRDLVGRLLGAIRDGLERPDQRRLEQVVPGSWWLVDRDDRAAAAPPLADRVEWAVFSLLSTAGALSESAFQERIASLFPVGNRADEALVRACLESYRSPRSTPERLATDEDLARRSSEHAEVIALLADLGHRFGMSVAIAAREQERLVRGRPLGERLDRRERGATAPLTGRVPAEVLAAVDCSWYVRARRAFLFEVEWTALLAEPVLRRHAHIPPSDELVRLLVLAPERVELVRYKLARSPLLRRALERDNWHVLTWPNLGAFASRDEPRLEDLEPYLGLDAAPGHDGRQLELFGEVVHARSEP